MQHTERESNFFKKSHELYVFTGVSVRYIYSVIYSLPFDLAQKAILAKYSKITNYYPGVGF